MLFVLLLVVFLFVCLMRFDAHMNPRRDIQKARAAAKKPLQELVHATKTAIAELRKAITAFQQRALKRTSGGGSERSRKASRSSPLPGAFLLDAGFASATNVTSHTSNDVVANGLDLLGKSLHEPVLVTFNEQQREHFFHSTAMKVSMDMFLSAFAAKVKKELQLCYVCA